MRHLLLHDDRDGVGCSGGKTGFLVFHLLPVNSVMVSILSLCHVPSSIRSSVSSLGELALT